MAKHFFYVTFDLENSKGRTNDYKRARDQLKFRFGSDNYWQIVKQGCIVRTNKSERDVLDSIVQVLGVQCNVLVVRLAGGYRFRLTDPEKRLQAKAVLQMVGQAED